MGLIEKIEDLINNIIFKLLKLLWILVPKKAQLILISLRNGILKFKERVQSSPRLVISYAANLLKKIKNNINKEKITPKFSENLVQLFKAYKTTYPDKNKFKLTWGFVNHIIKDLAKDLSLLQLLTLISLTIGSIFSIYHIKTSGKMLVHKYLLSRIPAEEEIRFERPAYYKKTTRHLDITNLRLPVFFKDINELKTVDIDFNITTSNRSSKIFIHKHDMHLRDHLLQNIEPIDPSFLLNDEGKEIIREKIREETNAFLKKNNIEGHVIEIRMIDILAN